jgi:hypothetical protein
VKQLRWLLTAAIAAYACQLAVHHATPIDRALPFIALVVTFVAALSYPSLMMGVPLLVVAEIGVPDEGMRLLAFGVILAAVFCPSSAFGTFSPHGGEKATDATESRDGFGQVAFSPRRGEKADEGSVPLAIAAILLLRWIPFSEVRLGRELFLLVIAALIVLVLDRTPFAVALAVIVVLITPAIPLRTLLLPLAVLFVAVLAKVFGMPRLALRWPSTIVLGFVMLFFAWSGVVARAFPYFLQHAEPEVPRSIVAQALPANAAETFDVPAGATSLIVSGANVARLTRGTPLGRIEPLGSVREPIRIVRIGDASDWGALRREYFYATRNPLPRDPAGRVRDYGYSAWIDGAGRVPLPGRARTIRVVADAALPSGAQLQVEGFE